MSSTPEIRNRGHGTFDDAADHRVGIFPNSVFAADFERNGSRDLAVSNGNTGTIFVLTSIL